jgi:hypothetical protein
MDIDELRSTWQAFGRALERQNTLALRDFRERRLERTRSSLRPLVVGQIVQIVLGVLSVALGAHAWSRHVTGGALLPSGIVIHAYGVVMIIAAGVTLSRAARIDYAAPVVDIQIALARLRRVYVTGSLALGLAWWVLWVPYALAGFDAVWGIDVYPYLRAPVLWMVATGVLGLCATLLLIRWSLRGGSPRLAQALRSTAAGYSLRRAKAALDELAEFTRDADPLDRA